MVELKKVVSITLLIFTILVAAIIVWFFILGYMSKSGDAAGLANGQLTRCPAKKNCVCSEYPDDTNYFIEPLPPGENVSLEKIKQVIGELGGVVTVEQDNYLAATFTSAIFGFVDDLEIRLDSEEKIIHIRSASRVGDSDLGVNRKRVQSLKQKLLVDA